MSIDQFNLDIWRNSLRFAWRRLCPHHSPTTFTPKKYIVLKPPDIVFWSLSSLVYWESLSSLLWSNAYYIENNKGFSSYAVYEGLNLVNRQPSKGLKFNCQPSKKVIFYRQPSKIQGDINR